MTASIVQDVETIGRMAVVPSILQVVARTTGLRFAAIARVTDTSWTACAVQDSLGFGLEPGGELPLESTICNEIRQHGHAVVIGDVSQDPCFRDHPTPTLYGFQSYISIPIHRLDGTFFGTLCALDPQPAKLDDPRIVETLALFAQLIAAQLDIEDRLRQSHVDLSDAADAATLREQFIAVLGHDLRNPLQMISLGVEMLPLDQLDAESRRRIGFVQRSCDRMNELIGNVLDFARGRLGGGIPVSLIEDSSLEDALDHVITELREAHADRAIEVSLLIAVPVRCDRHRIAQLLSNLLANALVHGAADQPVTVAASSDPRVFELRVSNGGQPIPAAVMAHLFEPFQRNESDSTRPGLGLGLFIAKEIARAHAGTLTVESGAERTTFLFRMPVKGR